MDGRHAEPTGRASRPHERERHNHYDGTSVRWLIDGMNVIGTRPDAWWKDRHGAMVRLVDLLERWVAASGEDVTVVFEQPTSPPISSPVISSG